MQRRDACGEGAGISAWVSERAGFLGCLKGQARTGGRNSWKGNVTVVTGVGDSGEVATAMC